MTDDLHASVLARIAKLRKVAQEATGGPWRWDLGSTLHMDGSGNGSIRPERGGPFVLQVNYRNVADGWHAATFNPSVMLPMLNAWEEIANLHAPKPLTPARRDSEYRICSSCQQGSDAFPEVDWPCTDFMIAARGLGIEVSE